MHVGLKEDADGGTSGSPGGRFDAMAPGLGQHVQARGAPGASRGRQRVGFIIHDQEGLAGGGAIWEVWHR